MTFWKVSKLVTNKADGRPDLFGMTLNYDNVGNITTWNYQNGQINPTTKAIENRGLITQAYTYDNLNRLQTSNLIKDNATYFELSGLNYDLNGNITSLNRKLQGINADVLTYTYKATPVAGVLTSPPLRKQCVYLSY